MILDLEKNPHTVNSDVFYLAVVKQIFVLRQGFDHLQISHMLTGALCVDHASLHDANAGVRTSFVTREVIV